jgi:hypothetical protein
VTDQPTNDSPSPDDNAPAPKIGRPRTRALLTEDRLAKYLEVLEQTGSHNEAARVATPHPNDITPGTKSKPAPAPGYASFYSWRKSHPDFEQACVDCVARAVGRAESELARRMNLPTERPTVDRNGNIVHISKDFRDANRLLERFLARHKPEDWTPRNRLDSNVTITGANNIGGAVYCIRASDLDLLGESDRVELMQILSRLEDARPQPIEQSSQSQPLLTDQREGATE